MQKIYLATFGKEKPKMVKIKSDTSDEIYEVNLMTLSCTCKDFIFRKAKAGGLCKHLIKEIERCTGKQLDFIKIIEKDNEAINFIEKYGEEKLDILKMQGDVFEKGGKLTIL